MMNLIACLIRLFTGVQAHWPSGRTENTQRIYFANHTSHFDFLVLWSVLPRQMRRQTCAAGAADYWTNGILRNWLATKVFKVIAIERDHITRENNPMEKLKEALDQGKSLIIFPEGGRNNSIELNEFKCGIYHLAKDRPNIDFVPVYINNANRILPKGEYLPVPLICSIFFGSSMRLEMHECKKDFLHRARLAVKECGHQ